MMRSLFLKIFLWFWVAQILIGASLYALAVAMQRSPEEMLRSGAGDSLEAWGRAAAIAYESGGRRALRSAWRAPKSISSGGNFRSGFERGSGGRRGRGGRDGGSGGPEDRGSACLYIVRPAPALPAQASAARLDAPVLLAGPPVDQAAATVLVRASLEGQAFSVLKGGGSWLARGIQTERGGHYVAAIRLRSRVEGFDPFRAWGGPGPGPSGLLRLLVVGLTMGAVCYALARYLTAPAVTLRRATQQFAEGDLSARVGPRMGRRRDELADLGRDFDRMAGRIQELLLAERRLLADISHELRSPLARMQVALDLVQDSVEGDASKYLQRIERESHRLNDLIGQLLTLSRLESGNATAHHEDLDLDSIVRDVVADADFEARPLQRGVSLADPQLCQVKGDEHLLRSAIENVVRNATRYTPQGTNVEVVLHCESQRRILPSAGSTLSQTLSNTDEAGVSPEQAVIRVRDHGPGVPEESLGRLFDPFYRAEDARDRQSGGVGLGLSITARAVRLHGGDVAAANAPGGGLLVEIRLPLSQS